MSDKSDRHRTNTEVEQVGAAFKGLRQRLSWTQQALAVRARVSRDTIHRLERGGVVDLSSLVALLGAMGQQIGFEAKSQLRAADMRRKFAHLHQDED
jgi:transcriptional regulator with XRE-family HTH domain